MRLLRRNIIANFLGQGWAALMGLLFIPVYIRYIGIEAYGLIGLFAVLQVWFGLLDMGFSPTLGREMARFTAGFHSPQSIQNLLRSLEMMVFALAVIVMVFVWTGADWLANDWLRAEKFTPGEVARVFSITSLVIGLRFCETLYRSAIFGLQRQVWFNGVHATLATLRHAGVVGVLALISPTINAFFLWHAMISLITVLIYGVKLHRLLPKPPAPAKFSRIAVTNVIGFAGGVLGINFLATLLTQVDKVLLSRLLSLEYFGYYTLAATIAGGLNLMIGPITQAYYPRMVEHATRKDNQSLAKVYHQGAQLVALISAPIMPILFIYSETILYFWSGDQTLATNTAPVLAPLVLGSYLNGLMWMPYQCQLANGWTSLTLKVNVIAVSVLVPAIIWLVPLYGAVAAAWLWVTLNVGYVLIQLHFMHKRILPDEKTRWYIDDVLKPTTGAFVVVGVLHIAFQPNTEMDRMDWGLYLFGLGIVVSSVTLLLLNQIWPLVHTWITRTVAKQLE